MLNALLVLAGVATIRGACSLENTHFLMAGVLLVIAGIVA